MARPDILAGPIGRTMVGLAWPVMAGEALHVAFHLVDVAWVGPLGAWATGAIMASMFALWMAFALLHLVTVGVAAHVSQAIGAGDRRNAGRVVAQAVWLTVSVSLVVLVLGTTGSGALVDLLSDDPRVREAGSAFLRIISMGLPLSFLSELAASTFRACGNTRTPLVVTGAAIAANAVLAPFLIFGWGPFPELGVPGSAIATVSCLAGGLVAYVVLAVKGHPDLPIDFDALRRPDWPLLRSMVRVGAPSAAIGILFSVVYLFYARLASGFGAAGLAVLGIANRLESITYLSADGFAVATSTFVGQNLGARNPARAARGAWWAAGVMSIAGAMVGAMMLLVPEQVLTLFTDDADALRLGVPYLRVLGLCQVFTGLEGVIGGGFSGAGNTLPPMLIHVVVALARIPLAWWAAHGLGLDLMGIAWTMSLTSVVRGLALAGWFSLGRWKHVRLHRGRYPIPSPEGPDESV